MHVSHNVDSPDVSHRVVVVVGSETVSDHMMLRGKISTQPLVYTQWTCLTSQHAEAKFMHLMAGTKNHLGYSFNHMFKQTSPSANKYVHPILCCVTPALIADVSLYSVSRHNVEHQAWSWLRQCLQN